MKKYMLVVIDRYDVSKSQTFLFESDLLDRKDVLCYKMCEIWQIDLIQLLENITVKQNDFVGVDLEEESYLLIEL